MESKDTLKSFTSKLIDYIYYINKSTLKSTQDSSFQVKTPSYSHVHKEIEYIWNDCKKSKEFSVEIIQQVENCEPLLLERWNFNVHVCVSKDIQSTYCELSSIIRRFMAVSSLLPSSNVESKTLDIKDSHLNTQWPASLAGSDICQFPAIPYRLHSSSHNLFLYVQYYNKPIKPHIRNQPLGDRPRFMSVGSVDSADNMQIRRFSSIESRTKVLANAASDSIYEENEVGIKLISSEYAENSDFEGEDFGRSSFDMEIDVTENSDTPEEAKVSLYMLSCDKIRELLLFKSTENFDPRALIDTWKNSGNI
jgi:hypothetical protein